MNSGLVTNHPSCVIFDGLARKCSLKYRKTPKIRTAPKSGTDKSFFFIFSVSATYRAKISPSRSEHRLGLFLLVLLQQAGKVRTGHICKNISQVDNDTWRYICKSLQSHRTFLRRFLSTQHNIFIDYGLSARDGQHSALFVSALASQQVFWYLSVFPLICRIS